MAKLEVKTGLLDADIIAYQIAATTQSAINWGDGDVQQYAYDPRIVEDNIDHSIGSLIEKLKLDDVVVCLTDATNFRKTVLPSYKMNRAGSLKPLHLTYAKEYMEKNYPTYKKPHLEADDVMGILSTHPKIIKGKKVIVSIDKDMKQIPGWLYNPDKDKKPRLVTAHEGQIFHAYQTLRGDPVDGYSGCPKVGDVNANRIIQEAIDEGTPWADHHNLGVLFWQHIVKTFEAAGLTEEDALVQARCARILQWQDYDYTNNEVILWQPPK